MLETFICHLPDVQSFIPRIVLFCCGSQRHMSFSQADLLDCPAYIFSDGIFRKWTYMQYILQDRFFTSRPRGFFPNHSLTFTTPTHVLILYTLANTPAEEYNSTGAGTFKCCKENKTSTTLLLSLVTPEEQQPTKTTGLSKAPEKTPPWNCPRCVFRLFLSFRLLHFSNVSKSELKPSESVSDERMSCGVSRAELPRCGDAAGATQHRGTGGLGWRPSARRGEAGRGSPALCRENQGVCETNPPRAEGTAADVPREPENNS